LIIIFILILNECFNLIYNKIEIGYKIRIIWYYTYHGSSTTKIIKRRMGLFGGSCITILKLIQDGYDDVNIVYNDTLSLINFIKISEGGTEEHHRFLYDEYIKTQFDILTKKYKLKMSKTEKKKKKKTKLKKADIIRIQNTDKKIKAIRDKIFEFVILDTLEAFLSTKKDAKNKHFYTLIQLMKFNVSNFNTIFAKKIKEITSEAMNDFSKGKFIKHAYDYIERNNQLVKYRDIKLYTHQKDLFTRCKQKGAKMLLYQAPTGTGKTLTPIGLVKGGHKIIFVCAAKHVGLQLAKSCISLGVKIAVAFGCADPGSIRLHWFAAKETIRNRRTGGIFRVDNEVGDNVEIMISDIQSYLPAMNYMRAFNKLEDMILYWDEPTITLDYETHPYHELLSKNWQQNEIPNVVLSSATLPRQEELEEMISGFSAKFNTTNVDSVVSHDCSKTIPILDTDGYIILPHLVYEDYDKVKSSVNHLKKYKTLLRHFDVRAVTEFIVYVNKKVDIKSRYKIDEYFDSIEDITVMSIKEYYLKLLTAIKKSYTEVFQYFKGKRQPLYPKPIKITTNDAYTLTDGPTIYLANDIEKIGKFCLLTAKIPSVMLDAILEDMGFNEGVRIEMDKIQKDLEKASDAAAEEDRGKSKGSDSGKTREISKKSGSVKDNNQTAQRLLQKYEGMRASLKRIRLGLKFIPNTVEHLKEWQHSEAITAFKSDIDDTIVEKIMLLDIDANWKVLLLMGIAVFVDVKRLTNDLGQVKKCMKDYVSIMKELAEKQKLYLIIASSDYIYGTNYQFCHGYIGKDLGDMSQEKMIQAIGRVGRSSTRQDYSIRLRSNDMIDTLLQVSNHKVEVMNMNLLFHNNNEEDE